tara:strand:+ start:159 stop:698 length:540 start_codon:yes stop_codon:yes gene_type:complete
MANFIIYDNEQGCVVTQLPSDPRIENPKYEVLDSDTRGFRVFEGEIDIENNLLHVYKLNAAKDGVENPYAGKTKQEQHDLFERVRLNREATAIKESKLVEIKTVTGSRLEDEYSSSGWRHEKATETDLLNGNNAAMTALATEKKAIRDAGNAHGATLAALDATTDAGADAILAFDAQNF